MFARCNRRTTVKKSLKDYYKGKFKKTAQTGFESCSRFNFPGSIPALHVPGSIPALHVRGSIPALHVPGSILALRSIDPGSIPGTCSACSQLQVQRSVLIQFLLYRLNIRVQILLDTPKRERFTAVAMRRYSPGRPVERVRLINYYEGN